MTARPGELHGSRAGATTGATSMATVVAVVAAAGLVALCVIFARPAWGQDARDARDADDTADHEIALPAQAAARVGDERALMLSIAPRPGYSISQDGPLVVSLMVRPDQGLALPRRRYLRRHAADPRAASPRFDLAYRAVSTGRYTVVVQVQFWLCQKRTCRPVRATRRVGVEVGKSSPP